jgi:uncharacterized protein YyaL (SSP411 family)
MPNHLSTETSPYLLQHAENPVDWYPWGQDALQKARDEDKPIFLSIGYSACHWCHVMAHESFEDQQIAGILNQHFVSIKVDREERPDLDQIYMSAVQALTGSGGWPMSVFLTPTGAPFYGGTYFPPRPRYGMPSFTDVLQAIRDAWKDRRDELLSSGQRLVQAIERQSEMAAIGRQSEMAALEHQTSTQPGAISGELGRDTLHAAFGALRQPFDQAHGGWGGAPKFPQPMVLEFLLRYHHTTGNPEALQMVTHTLEAMARGGMYDQIGGGFHRYSVDERWLTPHFEKMSYDNSQLARVYLHAWILNSSRIQAVTGNEFFRTITEEILDYVIREMTDPAGGFYSTQDADSEGEEGKFFVWTPGEIREVLGDEADAFMAAYGVTRHGNFEGKNILEFIGDMDQRPALADARRKLFEIRKERVHPARDEKVLTSWNGLMLAAFAKAARVLDRQDYRQVAERNADFLLSELRQKDGRLLHSWKTRPEQGEGAGDARFNGFLEDYSYLIEGLLELYQTTFDPRWYAAAQELAETMIARFQAPDGGFYDTSDDHETLITRPRDLQDNATPSGNAMAATTLLKLAGFTNDLRYVDIAHQTLAQMQSMIAQYPLGFGQWLQAMSYALSQPKEIAIVGEPEIEETRALLAVAQDGYRPFQVVALGAPDPQGAAVPLLRDRRLVNGRAAAYVCDAPSPGRAFACRIPVTEPDALRSLLKEQ